MVYSLQNKKPFISDDAFVAESSDIIGDVQLAEGSSVWFNAVLRGDTASIVIGENSNVQDNAVIHVTGEKWPAIVGKFVTIGHGSIIHGAELKDYAFVGMGATVLDGAIVESYGFVAAGALVPPGFVVPSYKLVAGVPARVIRDLKDEEILMIKENAESYCEKAKIFTENLKIVK